MKKFKKLKLAKLKIAKLDFSNRIIGGNGQKSKAVNPLCRPEISTIPHNC